MDDQLKAKTFVERVNEGNPDMSFLDDLWEKAAFIQMYRAQNKDGLTPFVEFVKDNLDVLMSDESDSKVREVLDRLGIGRMKVSLS